jgi:hypothetical protein
MMTIYGEISTVMTPGGVVGEMTIQSVRPTLSVVADPSQSSTETSWAEIDELVAASRATAVLRNAIRSRAQELLEQSMTWGNKLVFPPQLVEQVSAAGRAAAVLYLSTRTVIHKARHFVINAQINGIKLRDASHWLLRDATGRACRVSRPGTKEGTFHRTFAFPAEDGTLFRIFAHEAGDSQILKERFRAIDDGEVVEMDRDEYEDRLHGLLIMRRESRC